MEDDVFYATKSSILQLNVSAGEVAKTFAKYKKSEMERDYAVAAAEGAKIAADNAVAVAKQDFDALLELSQEIQGLVGSEVKMVKIDDVYYAFDYANGGMLVRSTPVKISPSVTPEMVKAAEDESAVTDAVHRELATWGLAQ